MGDRERERVWARGRYVSRGGGLRGGGGGSLRKESLYPRLGGKSLSRREYRGERERERERENERGRSRSRPFRGRKGGGGERERVRARVRWRGTSDSSTLSTAPSSCPPFMWDMAVRAEAVSPYSR